MSFVFREGEQNKELQGGGAEEMSASNESLVKGTDEQRRRGARRKTGRRGKLPG